MTDVLFFCVLQVKNNSFKYTCMRA